MICGMQVFSVVCGLALARGASSRGHPAFSFNFAICTSNVVRNCQSDSSLLIDVAFVEGAVDARQTHRKPRRAEKEYKPHRVVHDERRMQAGSMTLAGMVGMGLHARPRRGAGRFSR